MDLNKFLRLAAIVHHPKFRAVFDAIRNQTDPSVAINHAYIEDQRKVLEELMDAADLAGEVELADTTYDYLDFLGFFDDPENKK